MTQPADLVPGIEAGLLEGAGRPSPLSRRLRQYLPAMVLFLLALAVWEAAVTVFRIESFLLPKPSVIAVTFVRETTVIWPAGFATMREAVGGFVMGSLLGVIVALATARWTTINEGVLPFAIAINSTPIIALAPIMNQWFGILNPISKMSIVAVIVFFPVMINTVRGLTQVPAGALELMRSYAAREATVLRRVRIPNSLPYVFSALKVASTLSVIGAIVSEYFGGPLGVLGQYISQKASDFDFAEAWAGIIVACVTGIAFYTILLVVERLVMPWHVSVRAAEE